MNPSLRSGLKTKKAPSLRQKDGGLVRSGQASEQASLGQTILIKLSSIEELLKRSRLAGMPSAKDDKPLTFKDACAYLGYAPSYLYKLTYKNIVPHYKPTGKIIFFSKNELDEWIFKSRPHLGPLPKGEEEATKDPNQIEMDLSEEVLIEFPLKSRRRKEL
ncbi:MAG: helix-turn-helix domain-containing protein [Bacteroidota bacterium]